MGLRPDLDLSDIIPAYREFILGGGAGTSSRGRIRATPTGDVWESDGGEDTPPQEVLWDWGQMKDRSAPRLVGNGPKTCSTSQVVTLGGPLFSWDVNGWYRAIGVPFPYVNATSGVLSTSYVAAGGQESARATYCLKRLLNKPVRAAYDTYPLGSIFLDDDYVQDEIKARARAEAARRTARGSDTDAKSVMSEWGYIVEENDEEGLDKQDQRGFTGVQPEDNSPEFDPIEWVYAYWLWNTTRDHADTATLERWQTLVVSAVAREGAQLNIAVGLAGSLPEGHTVALHEGVLIAYLEEGREPTPELAEQAARMLLNQHTN